MFDWDDYLALAEDLAARPRNEAAGRSAISRAYYATFHERRGYLVRAGIPFDRGRNAHKQVRNEIRKQSEKIADDLERLHAWRKEADYDNPTSFDIEFQAAVAVTLARRTIMRIKSIR